MELIRYGQRGPMVEYLQLALSRAGYDPGNIDGIFGTRTLSALTRFQRAAGLAADGIAGRLTMAKLFPYLSGYTVHVVQEGDTLFSVAGMYATTVAAIETANPNVEANNLPIGAELNVPLNFPVVPENVSYSYFLVGMIVDGLTARYPFIRSESAGASVMGKRLYVLSMGTGETEVFYNAAHHANEWITTPLTLRFFEAYAAAFSSGGRIFDVPAQQAYESTTLYLMPLVNPDGVDLVTGALPAEDDFYQRARALSDFYPAIPFPSGWKANIAGTDLNLGYPADWDRARQIKYAQGYTRPGPRDFVGTAPLIEPENRAVYDFTRAHTFRLTLSYHTQGEVIYWKYLNFEPENSREIADAFARVSGYLVEETPYASGFAGYKDWFIKTYDRPGYTIEAGSGDNPLPISDLPAIYRDNIGILTLGMVLV